MILKSNTIYVGLLYAVSLLDLAVLYFTQGSCADIAFFVVLTVIILALLIRVSFIKPQLLYSILIFFIFFFPKIYMQNSWGDTLINNLFGNAQEWPYSFFDNYFIPLFSVVFFFAALLYRMRGTKQSGMEGLWAVRFRWFMMILAFISILSCGSYFVHEEFFPSSYFPLAVGGLFIMLGGYGVTVIPFDPDELIKKITIYSKILTLVLALELILVSIGAMPSAITHYSVDVKGGFGSMMFGASVYVGFFALLMFVFIFRDVIINKKRSGIVLLVMDVLLILSTFDRNPFFALILFLCIYLLFFGKRKIKMLFMVCAVGLLVNIGALTSVLDPMNAKGGDVLNASSTVDRLALQLRGIDVFASNPVLGYGSGSFIWLSVSPYIPNSVANYIPDPILFEYYDKVVTGEHKSNTHNMFILRFPELGMIAFAYLFFLFVLPVIFLARFKEVRENPEYSMWLFAILAINFFYCFQALPDYFVFYALLFRILILKKDQIISVTAMQKNEAIEHPVCSPVGRAFLKV